VQSSGYLLGSHSIDNRMGNIMVSDDKQYEFVSEQIRFHVNKIYDSFKLFIQLFSAIVGGSVWLGLQDNSPRFVVVSDVLVGLIAVVCLVTVFENNQAWRGYRKAQSRLGGKDESGQDKIKGPSIWVSSLIEMVMALAIIVAVGLFCRYNPFTI
jgi:hypothetical protein